MSSVSSTHARIFLIDSWNLQENFVADEARALLPHIGRTRVNLCANFLALLLFVFQENRLVDGLISVITADPNLHPRALYLLNSFLSLGKKMSFGLRSSMLVSGKVFDLFFFCFSAPQQIFIFLLNSPHKYKVFRR